MTDELPLATDFEPNGGYVLYPRRWLTQAIFCLVTFMQGYLYGMWAPLSATLERHFGWNQKQITLMPFLGTLSYCIFVFPASIFYERFSLRKTLIFLSVLIFSSTLMRSIPVKNDTLQRILTTIATFINGIAGALSLSAPVAISATWFGAGERKTSTSLGYIANVVGLAFSFIIGPIAVPQRLKNPEEEWNRYFYYTWAQTSICVLILALTLFFAQDTPPTPPSASAFESRKMEWSAMKSLVRMPQFWLTAAPSLLTGGMYFAWSAILSVNLKNISNASEMTAGWLGFSQSLCCIGSLVLAYVMSRYPARVKLLFFCCALLNLASTVPPWLACINIINVSDGVIYAAVIANGLAGATLPLYFEHTADSCYPVEEAISSGLLGFLVNLWISFVLIGTFVSRGTMWLNWIIYVAAMVAVPLTTLLPSDLRRTQVDRSEEYD